MVAFARYSPRHGVPIQWWARFELLRPEIEARAGPRLLILRRNGGTSWSVTLAAMRSTCSHTLHQTVRPISPQGNLSRCWQSGMSQRRSDSDGHLANRARTTHYDFETPPASRPSDHAALSG